jgi:hypothetical protein
MEREWPHSFYADCWTNPDSPENAHDCQAAVGLQYTGIVNDPNKADDHEYIVRLIDMIRDLSKHHRRSIRLRGYD